jgi:hypothetical protein
MRRGFKQAEPNNRKLARQVMAAVPEKGQQKLLAEEFVTEPKGEGCGLGRSPNNRIAAVSSLSLSQLLDY